MSNKINVLLVEPGKAPYPVTIDKSLEAYQEIVGGYIEIIGLEDNVLLVCNEEGKILGLDGNRRVGDDIIAGPFFICSQNGDGEIYSLSPEQMKKYKKRFRRPECYTSNDVQNCIRIKISTW